MIINSNLIKLAVEETIIKHKLKEAMDYWNSGETIEYRENSLSETYDTCNFSDTCSYIIMK